MHMHVWLVLEHYGSAVGFCSYTNNYGEEWGIDQEKSLNCIGYPWLIDRVPDIEEGYGTLGE